MSEPQAQTSNLVTKLRALVRKWRTYSVGDGWNMPSDRSLGKEDGMHDCAAELEEVLSGDSSASETQTSDPECTHENLFRLAIGMYECKEVGCHFRIQAAVETKPEELLWDTIAQNIRLATALKHVTESWVNGRRVLDGIGNRAAKLALEAFWLLPEQTTNDDIQVGGISFRRGVKVSIVLARIIRGTPSTLTDRPFAEETTPKREACGKCWYDAPGQFRRDLKCEVHGPRLGDPHPPSCACWECNK